MQDIPQDEQLDVDRLVEAMEDRRQLYRLADEAFLAVPSEKPDRLVNSELLAAKLLLVDRLPWQTVCRIVNSGRNDDEQLGRNDLDRLLSEPHVIRQLVYSELHWDNDKLCDLLLHRPTHNGKEAWTDHEVVAIQLRFQYVMLLEQIVPRLNGRLKKNRIDRDL